MIIFCATELSMCSLKRYYCTGNMFLNHSKFGQGSLLWANTAAAKQDCPPPTHTQNKNHNPGDEALLVCLVF